LAKLVITSFNDKLYAEAMVYLEELVTTRASDPIVVNNHAVVKFYVDGGGFSQVSALAYTLNTTLNNTVSGVTSVKSLQFLGRKFNAHSTFRHRF